MRDEVLAEWEDSSSGMRLCIFCHVSGGLVFGSASMRDGIFRRELPLVIEALRYGDREFFAVQPALDRAPIIVFFRSHLKQYDLVEPWGTPANYRLAG